MSPKIRKFLCNTRRNLPNLPVRTNPSLPWKFRSTAASSPSFCLPRFLARRSRHSFWRGVPQLMNYQGRVTVADRNFDGIGYFRFALVDGSADQTRSAAATSTISANGRVASVTITASVQRTQRASHQRPHWSAAMKSPPANTPDRALSTGGLRRNFRWQRCVPVSLKRTLTGHSRSAAETAEGKWHGYD